MNISQDPKAKESDLETEEKAVSVIVAGGLDPSGGAGIAADILAVHAAGAIALPVVTALTAQDSAQCYASYPVGAQIIEEQMVAVMSDFRPGAIKLGLVGSAAIAEMVAEFVSDYGVKLILDPVMASSTGMPLIDNATKEALASLLVPKAYLITPNASEAESLTGMSVNSKAEARKAAVKISEMGSENVLITGGHITGDNAFRCADYLYNGVEFVSLEVKREDYGEIRGTGCHLASSIAAYIARGYDLTEAVKEAKRYVTIMIGESVQGGQGARQAL